MNRLSVLWWTAKGVGWENIPRRLLQMWRKRSGLLRRRLDPARFTDEKMRAGFLPRDRDVGGAWAARAQRFFIAPSAEALRTVTDADVWAQQVTDPCNRALAGEYPFFSRWTGHLGWPPDFNLDPVHEIRWPVGDHWTGTARTGPPRDDIKLVWETSRLSLAYLLARAWARDGDERWATAFWDLVDAWIEQNPAQQTVAWGCGQETAFRMMAMLFGAFTTLHSQASTPERLAKLSLLLRKFGRSIDVNINGALAQKNNHGISEALGLWTLGLLFEDMPESARFLRRGESFLAAETRREIYEDGSFVQHSMNYHRVMMDDLLWAIRLSELSGRKLPPVVYDRFERGMAWLIEMVDPQTGRAPNYGSNDGAKVLPLSCSGYLDFRPVAQAAHYLLTGRRCFEPGPWDEKMLWLFGDDSLGAALRPLKRTAAFAAPVGGYYVLRGPNSRIMTRCHTYRDRPAQADMLHADLWYHGRNVLRDAGSYMYYCEEPWKSYFPSARAHNTLEVDGEDQMVRGPRFLWFRWVRSRMRHWAQSDDGRVGCFEGEHHGYTRLPGRVIHRRLICRIDDVYVFIDDVLGAGEHALHLRWRLCDAAWTTDGHGFAAEVSGSRSVRISVHASFEGPCRLQSPGDSDGAWESLYYGERSPIPQCLWKGRAELPVRIVTLLAPAESEIAVGPIDVASAVLLTGIPDTSLRTAVRDATRGRIECE